jgi:hypothetical protein
LHKKVGLLFCYWLTSAVFLAIHILTWLISMLIVAAISSFTLALGWLAIITAGHTKSTYVMVYAQVFLTLDTRP